MDIGHYAGNAFGGALGGAVAGALIGLAMHRKFDKSLGKPALAGAGVFAALAVVQTALGRPLPLVPKTTRVGAMPYGSAAANWLPTQAPQSNAPWAPWFAPNYYY